MENVPSQTGPDPAERSGSTHRAVRWVARGTLGLVILTGLASLVDSPWAVVRTLDPIDARELARSDDGPGQILIPIVDEHRAKWSEAVWYRLTDRGELLPHRATARRAAEATKDHGFVDPERLFRDTYEIATLVGAEAAGVSVRSTGEGVRVGAAKLLDPSPLQSGDIVIGYGAARIKTFGDLTAAVRGTAPGAQVRARLADGSEVKLPPLDPLVLQQLPRRTPNALGVNSVETVNPRVAGDGISWRAVGEIGGTSGGLALALAAWEVLAGRSLGDGRSIMATGEVGSDGGVFGVGGIREKANAAREDGAEVLVVANMDERTARTHARGVRVIGVDTVAEAITALEAAD